MATKVSMMDSLTRYRELVGDWEAFRRSVDEALPGCIWANPLRLGREELRCLLAEEAITAEPVDWNGQALRLPPAFRAGAHWGYAAGLFQTQEEVAMLPVHLLDPRPGERVLDLCAAPGNKSAQIALAMDNCGTLLANELKPQRISALRQTVKRLGLTNVSITRRPAQEFPLRAGSFDRVLVDVPCSGEGTVRKHASAFNPADGEARAELAWQQQRMLERALRLVRPGGRVVYATCTFAPEENECVVDAVLQRLAGQAAIVRTPGSGLEADAGFTQWQGRALDSRLADTLRIWPHTNNTGGFYIAVLERTGGDQVNASEAALPEVDRSPLAELGAHYRLPAHWDDGLALIEWGRRYRYLISAEHRWPESLRPEMAGLPVIALAARPLKLTTTASMRFGQLARANVVELDAGQASAFIRRQIVKPGQSQLIEAEPGHVIVRYRGYAIGVGDLRRESAGWSLASLYPKAWSAWAGVPENADIWRAVSVR